MSYLGLFRRNGHFHYTPLRGLTEALMEKYEISLLEINRSSRKTMVVFTVNRAAAGHPAVYSARIQVA
jgi:hypothetical protein